MASFVYNSALSNAYLGRIIVGTSTFKAMAVTNSYTEDKDAHTTRANITNEVSGAGYTAGGIIVVPTLTQDLATEKTFVTFPSVTWANSTLSNVRKIIYYVANGGAASGDWLFGINDLGADYSSNANSLVIAASSLTITNP